MTHMQLFYGSFTDVIDLNTSFVNIDYKNP